MDKITREQFLALPEGVIFIDVRSDGTGPAVKGKTLAGGSFYKRIVQPDEKGRLIKVDRIQTGRKTLEQSHFHVLDEVEAMACKALLFDHLSEWSLGEYLDQAVKFIETLCRLPFIKVVLPTEGPGSNAIH